MEMNVQQARDNLSRLIAAAEAGEEVTITRRGKPSVRIVAIREEDRRPSSGRAIAAWLRENPLPVGVTRMSASEIDEYIRAERDSWE